MKWTHEKPKKSGWYWFLNAGRGVRTPELAKVYKYRGRMSYHVGSWPGIDFADHFDLDHAHPLHRWSDNPIPVPNGMRRQAKALRREVENG